jgi:hypothetical protein
LKTILGILGSCTFSHITAAMLLIPALFRIAETGFVWRKMRRIDRGASPWLVTGFTNCAS